MSALTPTLPVLLQIGRTAPDTVLIRQVSADLGMFQILAVVGSTILAIAFLLLAIALLIGVLTFRKFSAEVSRQFERVYGDVTPIIRNTALIADDVKDVTTTVKGNVRQVQQTVASANATIQNAIRDTESQIQRFNNFLGVVQDEAQSAFVSTAATVRGVRTSVEAMLDNNDNDDEEFDDVDAPSEPPKGPRIRTRENERFSRS